METAVAFARENLIEFCCFVDPTQEQWYSAAHLRKIAEYLQAVERGEITRLMIVAPPRHWKSSLASEKFPLWYLGRHPTDSIIVASYGQDLADEFSRQVRNTIQNQERYQQVFPGTQVRRDTASASVWSLSTAYRYSLHSAGVGAGVTGGGANIIVVDDPIKDDAHARSDAYRRTLKGWYQTTLRTRAESNAAIILMQTRWHELDLAGMLLRAAQEQGGEEWTVVHLPALIESEPQARADPLGRKMGEALWEERFSAKELARIRQAVGPRAWQCLYQGEPTREEGDLIKAEWFEQAFFPALPEGVEWRARYWDLALTEKQTLKDDPDFTASVKGVMVKGDLWLGSPILMHKQWPEVVETVMAYRMNESAVRHGTGKALHETAAVQSLIRRGFYIEQIEEKGDKLSRAQVWMAYARQGRIKFVGARERWDEFLSWWWKFPNGAHDDSIDCTSGLCRMLGLLIDPVAPTQSEEYDWEMVEVVEKLANM